jgi:starch-binding outer membrane protein, SusD/RagB family
MKNIISRILVIAAFAIALLLPGACTKDLLDQQPTTELGAAAFWKTEADATTALMGAYADIRPLFDRDYYLDGHGEFVRTRGTSATSGNLRLGDAYQGANFNPQGYGAGFDKYYRYLYGGVNRANYVIENVSKMLPDASATSLPGLEAIVGEARLLRGMVYFRLISMWGDVPYFGRIIYDNSEVADIARMPIAQVKDSIMADFTYAIEKLPNKGSALGRAGKPAALAFRGKLHLYWASWNKNGWPELDGFNPSASEANASFAAAAADFKSVIEDFGLTLFRNGEPGEVGELGEAEVLPNYLLFIPNCQWRFLK